MQRPLILVVNEDTVFLEMMKDLLSGEGYETHLCFEGDKAFELIKKEKPDLVILDVTFVNPERAWVVLDLMQLNPETATIPVIVTSTNAPLLNTKRSYLEAHGILTQEKPFRLEELLTTIKRVLGAPPVGTSAANP